MNFGSTKNASESLGGGITAGIHKAIFKGVKSTPEVINTKSGMSNVMEVTFDVNGTEIKHRIFEPTSGERKPNSWGGMTPSQEDEFLINIRQILEALVPDIVKDIDNETKQIGSTFTDIVKATSFYTKDKVGTEVELKFLPNGRYANIPSYVARIDRDNKTLGIRTRWIGHNLTLTNQEQQQISAQSNAAPSNMPKDKSDLMDMIGKEAQIKASSDDLPF